MYIFVYTYICIHQLQYLSDEIFPKLFLYTNIAFRFLVNFHCHLSSEDFCKNFYECAYDCTTNCASTVCTASNYDKISQKRAL